MPDLVLVYERSKCDPTYLAQIRDAACMPAQIPHYLDLLHNTRRGRLLINSVGQAQISLSQSDDYEQVENYLIDVLTKSRAAKNKVLPVGQGFDVDTLLSGEDKLQMVPTGIEELDIALGGGIGCGEVCIMAGDTSIGKSATGIKISLSALVAGWPVQYESYEMSRKTIWQRTLAYLSGVSITKIRSRDFNDYDRAALRKGSSYFGDSWAGFTCNTAPMTPADLLGFCRVHRMQHDNFLLIVDTAQRMRVTERLSNYERGTKIIHELKDIALMCQIPVLVFWQLSRPDKATKMTQRRPTIHDLRDTGQAEEVADIIIFESRDSYYNRDIPIDQAVMTLDVVKGRDGCDLGPIDVAWLSLLKKNYMTRQPGDD